MEQIFSSVIFIVLVAFAIFVVAAFIVAEEAQFENPRKHVRRALEHAEYYKPGYVFEFHAHETENIRLSKGEIWNYTPYGWYNAKITRMRPLDERTLLMAAEVGEKSMPFWGPWVLLKVHDGGTPGAGVDYVWSQFLDKEEALRRFNSGKDPGGEPRYVLTGDLSVAAA